VIRRALLAAAALALAEPAAYDCQEAETRAATSAEAVGGPPMQYFSVTIRLDRARCAVDGGRR
jgi:hypothetical protein